MISGVEKRAAGLLLHTFRIKIQKEGVVSQIDAPLLGIPPFTAKWLAVSVDSTRVNSSDVTVGRQRWRWQLLACFLENFYDLRAWASGCRQGRRSGPVWHFLC